MTASAAGWMAAGDLVASRVSQRDVRRRPHRGRHQGGPRRALGRVSAADTKSQSSCRTDRDFTATTRFGEILTSTWSGMALSPLSSRLKIRQIQTALTVTSLVEELTAVAALPLAPQCQPELRSRERPPMSPLTRMRQERRRGRLDRHFLGSYIKAKIMAKG
jgi:hypothetical protein